MSVSKWRYTEKCDGDYCCGDCDLCDKEPEESEEEQMSKYINADALIQHCTTMLVEVKDDEIIQTRNNVFRHMREYIKSLPSSDVVEVVRCKDCEFYDKERNGGIKEYGYCEVYKGYKKADGFCDCGERRETE